MMKFRENKPTADILMNSMRAIGYSFESAISDIVDNSISARATEIYLKFPIDPTECYITIFDNGVGMTYEELVDAMKYGSQLKSKIREIDDLGRFGLGMKAASLSQCRRLTVVSKKDNCLNGFIWDLDIIEQKKDWYMIECNSEHLSQVKFIEMFDSYCSGTLVLWENFDFIEKSSGHVYSELCKLQEVTAEYLSLIFHRFLNGEGNLSIDIYVNNYKLKGYDPFLENHKKTNPRRRIEIPIIDSLGIERIITVQPYVLPFQKDLTNEDKKISGGIENYRSRQGFYVYRNRRLIIWGTWFGRHRDELTKYARIKVDIPNTLDDIWGIDIKKQNAKIPNVIKARLTKAVDEAMDIAVRVQTYRGRRENIDEHYDYIWDRVKERDNNYTYKINRESRIFDLIKKTLDDEGWARILMVLEEIENSIPYQQIYIDKSQNKVDDSISEERLADVEEKAHILIKMALDIGSDSKSAVIDRLFLSEPFSKYPELKVKLEDHI